MYLFVSGPADGKRMEVDAHEGIPLPEVRMNVPAWTEDTYKDKSQPMSSEGAEHFYHRRDLFSHHGGRETRHHVYQHAEDERPILQALVEGYRNA